jgi:uncharacterized protein (DUF2141 family)
MKNRYLMAASVLALFALTACPKNSDNALSVQQRAVNAQGATFASIFASPQTSEPLDIVDGNAGAVSFTSEPNLI